MKDLALWCLEFIAKHPQHAKAVNDFYVLALDEVEQGESEQNEIELCMGSIKDLI